MCISQGSVQDETLCVFKNTEIYLNLMVDKLIFSDYKKFRAFFVTSSDSVTNFEGPIGFLIFL